MGPKQQVAKQLVGNLLFGVHWIPFFWVEPKQQVAKQLVGNLLFGVHWIPFFFGWGASSRLPNSWLTTCCLGSTGCLFWVGPSSRGLGCVLGLLGSVLRGVLGVSWGRLGPDFRSKGKLNLGIPSWVQFSYRCLSDPASKKRSPNLEKSFNSIWMRRWCSLASIWLPRKTIEIASWMRPGASWGVLERPGRLDGVLGRLGAPWGRCQGWSKRLS